MMNNSNNINDNKSEDNGKPASTKPEYQLPDKFIDYIQQDKNFEENYREGGREFLVFLHNNNKKLLGYTYGEDAFIEAVKYHLSQMTATDSESASETHGDQELDTPASTTENDPPISGSRFKCTPNKFEVIEEDPAEDVALEPKYNPDWISSSVRPFAEELHRVKNAPLAGIDLMLSGFTAMTLGKGLGTLNPATGHKTLPNLQTIIAAPVGSWKSSVADHAIPPINECIEGITKGFNEKSKHLYEQEYKDIEKELAEHDKNPTMTETAYLNAKNRLEELERLRKEPEFKIESATRQAIEVALANNNGAISFYSPDAKGVLDNIAGKNPTTGSNGNVVEDEYFIKGFCQDPIMNSTLGRGRNYIERPWVSSLLMTQPEKGTEIISNQQLVNSGFISRQVSYINYDLTPPPKSVVGKRVIDDWSDLVKALFNYRIGIGGYQADDVRSNDDTKWIDFTPTQSQMMQDYAWHIYEERLSGRRMHLGSVAVRLPIQATIFAIIHHAQNYGKEAHKRVTLDTHSLDAGIQKAEYFFERLLLETRDAAEDQEYKRKLEQVRRIHNLAKRSEGRRIKPVDVKYAKITKSAKEAKELLEGIGEQYFQKVTLERSDGSKGNLPVWYILK